MVNVIHYVSNYFSNFGAEKKLITSSQGFSLAKIMSSSRGSPSLVSKISVACVYL